MSSDWIFRLVRIAADRLGDYRMRRDDSEREIERLISIVREKIPGKIGFGVISGSGLAGIAGILSDRMTIREVEVRLPGYRMPHTRLPILHVGTLSGIRVLVFESRYHIYEGFSAWESTIPIRLIAGLGARAVVLTCATGSLRRSLPPGSILLIRDHINLSFRNPGRGVRFGPSRRFVQLDEPYSERLAGIARSVAVENGFPLREGVLVSVSGPSYETRAEARMLRALGGDVVSMSTVSETIVSRMFGMEVLGLAGVTNYVPMEGAGSPVTHEDVLAAGKAILEPLSDLVEGIIGRV